MLRVVRCGVLCVGVGVMLCKFYLISIHIHRVEGIEVSDEQIFYVSSF